MVALGTRTYIPQTKAASDEIFRTSPSNSRQCNVHAGIYEEQTRKPSTRNLVSAVITGARGIDYLVRSYVTEQGRVIFFKRVFFVFSRNLHIICIIRVYDMRRRVKEFYPEISEGQAPTVPGTTERRLKTSETHTTDVESSTPRAHEARYRSRR